MAALFGNKKSENKAAAVKVKTAPASAPKESAKTLERKAVLWHVKKPLISEKAMRLSEGNAYTFAVDPSSNKSEVRKQIERLYNVDVVKINMVSFASKSKRFRGLASSGSRTKKAIVTVKKGQKIELFNK